MKRHLPLAALLVLILAGLSLAQEPSPSPKPLAPQMTKAQALRQLSAIETKLWEGWKNKDLKPFRTYLAADSVLVGDTGVAGKDDTLKALSGPCEVRSFSLSNWQVARISPATWLLTYKGTQDVTCGGEAIPPTVWASTVWVMRRGRWRAFSHQETPAR